MVLIADVGFVSEKIGDDLQVHGTGHIVENDLSIRCVVAVDQKQLVQNPIIVEKKVFKHSQGKRMRRVLSAQNVLKMFAIIIGTCDVVVFGIDPEYFLASMIDGDSVRPGDGVAIEQNFDVFTIEVASNDGRVGTPIGDKQVKIDWINRDATWLFKIRLPDYGSPQATFVINADRKSVV